MTSKVPSSVVIPAGYTVRVIDNYAGDHDAEVVPGRYELEPSYRHERAEWTRSGKDEKHLDHLTAMLTIREPERQVATVLYAGRALATKTEPAHEVKRSFTVAAYELADLETRFPTLTFEFAA